ncbi:hypothetical protein ACHAXT_008206, partial [Thalassiosira profunda]
PLIFATSKLTPRPHTPPTLVPTDGTQQYSTMASYFKQLSDDMERVAQVVEEGAKFMMGSSEHVGAADSGDDGGAGADPGDDMHDSGDPAGGEGDGLLDDLEDAVGGASPLMGMADSVMSDIMSSQVGPQTAKEHIQAFIAAITWDEPFIQCIVAFHVLVITAAIILTRKGGVYSRMGLMVFVGILIRLAEWLNDIGARRWREFATQNYFDKSGIFMGIMLCAPLLLVCLALLLSMTWEAKNLLVDVKAMKVKAQAHQKQKKDGKEKKRDEKRRRKED